jgi:serine/threonine protein phosphatase PrpC
MKYWTETAQGHRPYQEDRVLNEWITNDIFVSCVFDGHGGDAVAEFCKQNMGKLIKQQIHDGVTHDMPQLIRNVVKTMDSLIEYSQKPHIGSTLVMCIITPSKVYFANAGDSLAIIKTKANRLMDMSIDHKVDNPHETNRIRNSGGVILYDTGMGRVDGNLNLARSLGDFYLKKWVISTPFIRSVNRAAISYIFLASDGIWDVFTKETIDTFLKNGYKEGMLEKLIQLAINNGSTDNCTCTFIEMQ